jgi:hypothetical protein
MEMQVAIVLAMESNKRPATVVVLRYDRPKWISKLAY